jgi:hypothetical protein
MTVSPAFFRSPSTRCLLLVLLVLVPFSTASAKPPLSIAQARSLPLGTTVTVDGSVTTPSGAFESSFFDVGFGLQDATGGLYVSLQTDLGVAPRAQARVTGVLQDSFGLLLLIPADPAAVKPHGAGPRVAPLRVSTSAVSEATEGLLVEVVGTVSQAPTNDLPFGFIFAVNDGSGAVQIFVNVQTGIDVSGLTVGQPIRVIGFSSQFADHYEIDPRSPSDLAFPVP